MICELDCQENGSISLRLGLRYARGLRESAVVELVAARVVCPFVSIEELARRVPSLTRADLAVLAEIGALEKLLRDCTAGMPFGKWRERDVNRVHFSHRWTKTKSRPRPCRR